VHYLDRNWIKPGWIGTGAFYGRPFSKNISRKTFGDLATSGIRYAHEEDVHALYLTLSDTSRKRMSRPFGSIPLFPNEVESGRTIRPMAVTRVIPILLATVAFVAAGCGYTLQGSRSPLLEKEGIRRVFVAPLVNDTFKPGVEGVVYNALIKTLAAHRRVVLVQHRADADAVLTGTVTAAGSAISASTEARNLNPSGIGPSDIRVATEYSATLGCSFKLVRERPRPGKAPTVWQSGYTRSKPFPGANQLGVLGTTSALINESEFDRALFDLANSMMADVHESMLAMF
jgi:hypothetical protein